MASPTPLGLGPSLEGLLLGVDGIEALALGGAIVVLGSFAATAAYFPARRASRIDPMKAPRSD